MDMIVLFVGVMVTHQRFALYGVFERTIAGADLSSLSAPTNSNKFPVVTVVVVMIVVMPVPSIVVAVIVVMPVPSIVVVMIVVMPVPSMVIVMIVVMPVPSMVISVIVTVTEPAAVAMAVELCGLARGSATKQSNEQCDTETCDQHTTRHTEPAEHNFTGQRTGDSQGHPKEQHAAGVGCRHRRPNHHRVSGRALAASDVGGHHRLAMPRKQRVGSTKHQSEGDRQQPDAEGQIALADQAIESTVDGPEATGVGADSIDRGVGGTPHRSGRPIG
jgi:hypothetical protein